MSENKKPLPIIGAGGGSSKSGSSGGSSSASEDADTLRSRAMVSVLDLIGEGQIGGLVNGAQSVYLGDLPLQNADLSYNFNGVTWEFRNGTQDQTPINGFTDIETPYNISQQVKNGLPITFGISNPNTDQVRVIMLFPALTSTDTSTGDIHGATVKYKFQLAYNGGSFNDVAVDGGETEITLTGKKNGKYQRNHTITLPKPGTNYQIRAVRISADSSTYYQNDTYVDSYFEIVNSKLSYPNSALFGISIDSSQFDKVPDRSFLVRGMYIRIPTNYDPDQNTYSGTWDGTFKLGVTSNPAWILYDILTNTRYGLGGFISASQINRGKIYQIGRYCDGLVSNGVGGMEPRFAINTAIATRADAYQVVRDIASAFRGMVFWSGGMVNATQDAPADPIKLFSTSNVVDGLFTYTGSARKDRHSVAQITYNNPDDHYKQNIEYVEDASLIQKYGVRKYESVAFGCTSRSQAHRIGQWVLYSESAETDIITFSVGLDSALLIPGDIVKIQDQYRAGRRMSGRITGATATSIKLDAPVTLNTGTGGNLISIMMPDGTFVDRQINETGTVSTVTFTSGLVSLPVPNAIWIITQPDLKPFLARVSEIKQNDDGLTLQIGCTEHNPSKFGAIEEGLVLDDPDNTVLDPTFSTPENMQIDESTYFSSPGNLGTKLHVSWEGKSPRYEVSWRRVDVASNWTVETVTMAQYELLNAADDGRYDFSVVGISVSGRRSEALVGTYQVLGSKNPPGPPTNLTAQGDFRSVILQWANPSNLDLDHVEIYENSENTTETATRIAKVTGTQFTRMGLPGLVTRYYWAKAVNKRGLMSQFNSNLGTSAITLQATHEDVVKQFVDESLLVPDLVSNIHANQAVVDQLQGYFDKAAETQTKVNQYEARIAAVETFVSSFDDGTTQYATKEDLLQAKNETQQAVIDHVMGVMAGPTGTIATEITKLRTEVDGKFSAIAITAETINGLSSQYTVKIDNNGYVAGFGLASTSSNGVPTSEFLILADRFAIAQPNQGQGVQFPFVVTSVNGVPRVSMNSAFITEIIAAILKSPDNKFRIDLQNKLISIEV